MMKKKWMACALAVMAVISGCGNAGSKEAQPAASSAGTVQAGSGSSSGKKALVVYYSWSGNTRKVAEDIQKETGADMFEIVPEKAYPTAYQETVDLARKEQAEKARPAIRGRIDNIGQYDVIYLGYPNWWGDMPMVLYTFLESYDLSGKTIAPFCTSGGSGLSDTVNAIKGLEPKAAVTEGFHIYGSQADSAAQAVHDWLMKAGLL